MHSGGLGGVVSENKSDRSDESIALTYLLGMINWCYYCYPTLLRCYLVYIIIYTISAVGVRLFQILNSRTVTKN
jgi:hypothetical protein